MKTQKCKYLLLTHGVGLSCAAYGDDSKCPKSRLKGDVSMYCYKVPRDT